MARRAAAAHALEIVLDTAVGVGTTFTVVLPIGDAVPAARAA